MIALIYKIAIVTKLEPNTFKIIFLPIILSSTSQKIYSMFLFHSYILAHYSYVYCSFFSFYLNSLSSPSLKPPHLSSSLASILIFKPNKYPLLLNLCFLAPNRSRIIMGKRLAYNSLKLCQHIRLKPNCDLICKYLSSWHIYKLPL